MTKKNKLQKKQTQPAVSLETGTDKPGINRTHIFLILILLSAATYLSYLPSLKNGFTNWDDPGYVIDNDLLTKVDKDNVLSSDNIKEFFKIKNEVMLNYHPLTMITLAWDYRKAWQREKLFAEDIHLDPRPFHNTNLLLHILNTLMIFWLIYALTKGRIWIAIITSLLFGVHPMHVESVAWVSARKDLMYTLFFSLGLLCYIRYIRENNRNKQILLYLLTLLLYLSSLLSKAMATVFPLVCWLIDIYTGRMKFYEIPVIGYLAARFKKEQKSSMLTALIKRGWFYDKLPMLILSIVFGLIAVKIQSKEAISHTDSLTEKILISGYGWLMYIWKFIAPVHLSTFYPYFDFLRDKNLQTPLWFYLPATAFFITHIYLLVQLIRKGLTEVNRAVFLGLLYYFFGVMLVLKFLSVGAAIMADRYTYLCYTGLFFIAGWYIDRLGQKSTGHVRILILSGAAIWIILLSAATYNRTKVWKNAKVLFTDVINKYPLQVEDAYKNRGNYFAIFEQDYERALADYESLITMSRKLYDHGVDLDKAAEAYSNLGNIYALNAEKYRNQALQMQQEGKTTEYKTLITLSVKNMNAAAEAYSQSSKYDPKFMDAYLNKATMFIKMNEYIRASESFEQAYLVDSTLLRTNADFYFYRGYRQFTEQKYLQAISSFNKADQLRPNNRDIYYNISVCHLYLNNRDEAIRWAIKAKAAGHTAIDGYLNSIKQNVR